MEIYRKLFLDILQSIAVLSEAFYISVYVSKSWAKVYNPGKKRVTLCSIKIKITSKINQTQLV